MCKTTTRRHWFVLWPVSDLWGGKKSHRMLIRAPLPRQKRVADGWSHGSFWRIGQLFSFKIVNVIGLKLFCEQDVPHYRGMWSCCQRLTAKHCCNVMLDKLLWMYIYWSTWIIIIKLKTSTLVQDLVSSWLYIDEVNSLDPACDLLTRPSTIWFACLTFQNGAIHQWYCLCFLFRGILRMSGSHSVLLQSPPLLLLCLSYKPMRVKTHLMQHSYCGDKFISCGLVKNSDAHQSNNTLHADYFVLLLMSWS